MDGNEVSLKRKRVTCLLVVIAILAASFLVMDWLLFFRCGAVEQCLVGGSVYQNVAKFAVTAFAALVVFLIGKDCLSSRDRTFLQAAFVMAVCADFCMKIVSGYALVGIGFFMAVQTLLIVRQWPEAPDSGRIRRVRHLLAYCCLQGFWERLFPRRERAANQVGDDSVLLLRRVRWRFGLGLGRP